MQWLNEMQRAQ